MNISIFRTKSPGVKLWMSPVVLRKMEVALTPFRVPASMQKSDNLALPNYVDNILTMHIAGHTELTDVQHRTNITGATTFHGFRQLPYEIRDMIWGIAFYALGPVIWVQKPQAKDYSYPPVYCVHGFFSICASGCLGRFFPTFSLATYDSVGPWDPVSSLVSSMGPFRWCNDYVPRVPPGTHPGGLAFRGPFAFSAMLHTCRHFREQALKAWRSLQKNHDEHADKFEQIWDYVSKADNTLSLHPSCGRRIGIGRMNHVGVPVLEDEVMFWAWEAKLEVEMQLEDGVPGAKGGLRMKLGSSSATEVILLTWRMALFDGLRTPGTPMRN